jgi:hypothetical protein
VADVLESIQSIFLLAEGENLRGEKNVSVIIYFGDEKERQNKGNGARKIKHWPAHLD